MNLRTDLKTSLRHNVPLSRFSTMQVGGPAAVFAEPAREEELLELLEFARHENLPFFILGKGSNVIFPDEGFPGLVITLIHFEQDHIRFDSEKSLLSVSSGIYLYRLALACRDMGIAGTEFLANIPGTFGGALYMNAGFSRFPGQRNEISDLVEDVTVINPAGKKEIMKKEDLEFSYRRSNLEGKVILSGTLRVWKRNKEIIEKEIRANFEYRNQKQDLQHPSSGSIFKNPPAPSLSAGRLIDQCGLKGTQVGGAMVSPKHGNYIVNAGGAKSSDIIELIHKIQKWVLDGTGVLLEPEVRIIEKA